MRQRTAPAKPRGCHWLAELPGLKKQDVSVTFENGALKISGERKQEKEEKGRHYHRVECSYGRFSRSFVVVVPQHSAQAITTFD